ARPLNAGRPLALAAARSDEEAAAAQVKLARSQRIPDVTLSAGARRLPINNDVAAVFGISVPLPLFNGGTAAVEQANAEQERASALRRMAELDADQAVTQAEADVANAAATARVASGPALASAEEAARIARIGYREGKFGQLDLIDAERTLAEIRAAAIDALAAFHDAQAELDRLTTTISKE
ncbi:MAG: TolC family protein, partial [Sphingomonas oligoaromativorans]